VLGAFTELLILFFSGLDSLAAVQRLSAANETTAVGLVVFFLKLFKLVVVDSVTRSTDLSRHQLGLLNVLVVSVHEEADDSKHKEQDHDEGQSNEPPVRVNVFLLGLDTHFTQAFLVHHARSDAVLCVGARLRFVHNANDRKSAVACVLNNENAWLFEGESESLDGHVLHKDHVFELFELRVVEVLVSVQDGILQIARVVLLGAVYAEE